MKYNKQIILIILGTILLIAFLKIPFGGKRILPIENPPNANFGALIFSKNVNFEKPDFQKQTPLSYFQIITATTTYNGVAKTFTHFFDTPFQEQGGCYKFKDKSGIGYTYLTVEDGIGTFSAASCE